MRNIIIVLILTLSFACKNEVKNDGKSDKETQTKTETLKNELIVEIHFKTNKKDYFKLMLSNIVVDEFQNKHITIVEAVSPSTLIDKLIANFGEGNMSNSIEIILGDKEEKEIEIESMQFSYGSNELNISATELSKYFTFNNYITQDEVNNKLFTHSIEGKLWPVLKLNQEGIGVLTKN
jgi:hypothetical protein